MFLAKVIFFKQFTIDQKYPLTRGGVTAKQFTSKLNQYLINILH